MEIKIIKEGIRFKINATSALGGGTGIFEVDPSVYSRIDEIKEHINDQENLDGQFVEEFGMQLFEMLFSHIKDFLHECLDQSSHLEIILDIKDPSLNVVPWELCYDPEYYIFLGADPQCSLVRRDQKTKKTFNKINYPLKILVIISSPMDLDEKGEYQPDPDEIMQLMKPLRYLEEKGMVKVDFLERASVQYIQDALKEGYHIVHFIGHGFYNGETGKGYLIIEDKNRNSKKLEGRHVAQLFGTNPPQLLFLTACESAPLIPFLLRKIPAVLAMQYTVLKNVAHYFVERFYSLLVKGDVVPRALSNARNAVFLEEGKGNPGWFTPVLYLRSENILRINTESPLKKPEKKVMERFDIDKDLIGVETFVGRRKDLWLIEKALFEENLKLVVVTGIGGIGKTALASTFVRKHRNRFRGVFAKKVVDPLMGAEELLELLDRFFMRNSDQRLHEVIGEPDLDLKLEVLNYCLKKEYFIVLDNFETLIEDLKISNEEIEKFLQTVLFGDHTSKVLITSRYGFTFRDEKADGLIKPVDLNELSFQFVGQLLENFGIKSFKMKKRIYRNVGGNPQFLEFFVRLAKTRPIERLLEDITPIREKIGEWLLNELVGLLTEKEREMLKKISVFRLGVERDVFDVLGASDETINQLIYYSLVKFDKYYFMHPGVREHSYALLSDDEKRETHSEAAEYYRMLIKKERANLMYILELHHHLIESGQYEKAGDVVLELSEPLLRWGYWGKLMELLMQTVKTTNGRTKIGAMLNFGTVLQNSGNYKNAEKLYKKTLTLAEDLGDKVGVAGSLHQLGRLQYLQGNYKNAEKFCKKALKLAKSLGDKKITASSLHQLGMLEESQGNYKEAEKFYNKSLNIAEDFGDKALTAKSLHQLGNLYYLQGSYTEAEKFYKKALKLNKSFGDKAGIARSSGQLGALHYSQGNYKEAEKFYRKSLEIAKSLGYKALIATSLHQLGNLYYLQGSYTEAEKFYRKSLEIAEDLKNKSGIAASLHQLGLLQEEQGNYAEAEKFYRKSLEIAEDLKNKTLIATSLHQLGILQEHKGNYTEAEKLYRKALKLKKILNDKAGIAKSLQQLGLLQEEQGNYTEAEKFYRESLDIKENLNDKAGIAASLHNLGMLRQKQGDFKKAEILYRESLDIKENLNDKAGIAALLHQLGILQQYKRNYTEAEKFYKESLAIKKNLGDKAGIASSLFQLGNICYLQKNYKEAERLYQKSLTIAKALGHRAGIALLLHQLGMLQEEERNYEEAERLYRESLAIKENLNDKAGIAETLGQLGNLYYLQKNYEEAEKFYNKSLDLAKILNNKVGIAKSLHQLGIVFEKRKDYEKALQHYITALSMFSETGSPEIDVTIQSLQRVRKISGQGLFEHCWRTITKKEVPYYFKSSSQKEFLENFIQDTLHLVENNEQEQIIQAKKDIKRLLKENIDPSVKQFFHLLSDFLSGKDISDRIKELDEPFRSALEKHMK